MADNAYGQTSSNGSEHASSRASSPRQYQATVEDDPESFLENRSSCDSSGPYLFGDDNQGPHHQADSQIGPDRRPSVLRSASSHPSHLPHDKTTKNPRAPRIRHGNLHVHFSERQPPQTYSAKNIAPPEDTRPRQNSSRPRVSSSCQQGRFKSAVDLRWGLLFNENGYPTERLKQLLGGIAEHLILEQEPKNSLVISPTKLYGFYKNYPYKTELIPFTTLFRCNSSQDCRALESMYQDMQCQYHLVPEGGSDIPNTPALTAAGFVRWMVCCILAAPDQEAYRLDKIVQALPIETRQLVEGGGGGLPERLPKQLSRHLLPVKPNETTKDQLLRACKAKKLPTAQSSAPAQNDSATPPRHSSSKRGREDHRDDNSRRYVPQTRVNDGGRDRSRSRSGYQHSTRHESDKTPRRSSYDHRSPDRTSKHYPDASPRSNRRSSIYETSRSKVDDSYYRDRGHGEKTSASLKRTSSTKDSRRHMSPPRDSRQSYRDWSPNRYSHSRKGSRHESSSGSSPRDSFDNDASGDSRGRHERQGSFSKTTGGDSARAKRRA